ncbi:MAG: hypothetical protein MUP44_10260 [Anaerolineales bacterium]|nr:hypothetical protein [Anaerolineales bacterium]
MMLQQLMKMVVNTHADEIDCDGLYQVVDIYAEAIARGEDPSEILPLVKHHLEICKPCLEEYEALLRILEATPSISG